MRARTDAARSAAAPAAATSRGRGTLGASDDLPPSSAVAAAQTLSTMSAAEACDLVVAAAVVGPEVVPEQGQVALLEVGEL